MKRIRSVLLRAVHRMTHILWHGRRRRRLAHDYMRALLQCPAHTQMLMTDRDGNGYDRLADQACILVKTVDDKAKHYGRVLY
jgi:hypothetical protein